MLLLRKIFLNIDSAQAPMVAANKSYGTLDNVRYLSNEWITEANKQIKGLTPLSSELVIKYEVVDCPSGDRPYYVVFGPNEMAVVPNHYNSNVTLSLPWDCAKAIATGAISAQRAFLDGTMSLTGDAATLIGHQEIFSNVMDLLSDLREQTEYI